MLTILNIGGTDYDRGPTGRPAAGIENLRLTVSVDDDWSLEFTVLRKCGTSYPFAPGQQVTLTTTNDDGTGSTLRFKGDLLRPEVSQGAYGRLWSYRCSGLKHRADWVTLLGLDGSATANFNLPPNDYLALYATSGKTVGEIVTAVLQAPSNAANLNALGVGAYTTLSPPTLPAATVADLALLTIVPPDAVRLSGESILNTLEQFILHWHPRFALWVLPNGTIRVGDVFNFAAKSITLPTSQTAGDPVEWPEFAGPDCTNCFTSWTISGLDIRTAYLNTKDGTLSKAWSGGDETAWTIADFVSPRKSADEGATSSVTLSGCTVTSDNPAASWAANYWSGASVGGWVYLSYPVGTGINLYEVRQITSCTAKSAGGTATITWDSSLPLNSTSYTRYRLVGLSTPQALVGRDYHVREPGSGNTDLNTLVGGHLYPVNPKGMPVANNSRAFSVTQPYAFVQWSRTGDYPYFEIPVGVQVNPLTGRIVLIEPAVVKSAGLAGTTALLTSHYPASFAEGLYYNLQVVVPWNAGQLQARSPTSGNAGTAFTTFGIVRPKVEPRDEFVWVGDKAAYTLLAAERLKCYQDAVYTGTLRWHGVPTAFDPFVPGYSLSVSYPGGTTGLEGINLPVRATTIQWTTEEDDLHVVTFSYSNYKRPFEGDDLFAHAHESGGYALLSDDSVFVGGMIGGQGGMMDALSYQGAAGGVADAISADAATRAMPGSTDGRTMPDSTDGRTMPGGNTDGTLPGMPNFDDGSFDGAEDASPGNPTNAASRKAGKGRDFVGPPRPRQDPSPADPAHPDSIMNMAGNQKGFGPAINPDASPYPDSIANPDLPPIRSESAIDPEKKVAQARKPSLREQRGIRPPDDDNTNMGGG